MVSGCQAAIQFSTTHSVVQLLFCPERASLFLLCSSGLSSCVAKSTAIHRMQMAILCFMVSTLFLRGAVTNTDSVRVRRWQPPQRSLSLQQSAEVRQWASQGGHRDFTHALQLYACECVS